MTVIEIAMLLYCASFRWPVIVMRQLHEKKERELTNVRDDRATVGIPPARVREKEKKMEWENQSQRW